MKRLSTAVATAMMFLLAATLTASPAAAKTAKATVNPGPTARHASMYSEISFRGVTRGKAGKITVSGSRTGNHSYSRRRHSDNRGFSLVMKRPFAVSESVKVQTALSIPGARQGNYRFKVENLGGPRFKKYNDEKLSDGGPVQFRSNPGLLPPPLDVRKNLPGAGTDPLLVGAKSRGSAIYQNDGSPIWFRAGRSTDFRAGVYHGRPVLTWFEAPTPNSGIDRASYTVANQAYKVIERFAPGNGYAADSHEFRLTDRNTAFITSYRTVRADLRYLGLKKNGRVSDSIAQEIDLKTGRVIWEWHSLDHVPIKQSYAKGPKSPGSPYDYFHINSIIDTPDGNVMISGRSTNTVYKVSRSTGRIIWALGGKRSDYELGPGAEFSWQHDSEPLSGNRVSLFDNSDSPVAKAPWADQSRGMVLKLNNKTKTATLEAEFKHPSMPLAPTQANVEALPSGNFLVGFGQIPIITEFDPAGNIVYDASVKTAGGFYRAYRQPWVGRPDTPVDIAEEASGPSSAKVWVSWNGDTEVRNWRISSGPSGDGLTVLETVPRQGFETTIDVVTPDAFVKVDGLDASGAVIGSTAITRIR